MKSSAIIGKIGKPFVANVITGIGYLLAVSLTFSLIGSWIQVEDGNDIRSLGEKIASYEPMALVLAMIGLIIIGTYVVAFGLLHGYLRQFITGDKDKKVKFDKRPAILVIAGAGFVFMFLFWSIQTFFNEFTDISVNVLDGNTLLTALIQLRLDIVIVSLIGIAVIGWLTGIVTKQVPKISDKLPDQLKKI